MKVTTVETLETGVDGANAPRVNHSALDLSGTLNASSTPPAAKIVADVGNLVAGAKTIDLTALTGTGGATVSFSGLKLQILRFKNNSATNTMTIGEGAATGYELQGNAWSVVLNPGDEIMIKKNDTAPDVSGSLKHIDIAGTGTDEYEITLIAG